MESETAPGPVSTRASPPFHLAWPSLVAAHIFLVTQAQYTCFTIRPSANIIRLPSRPPPPSSSSLWLCVHAGPYRKTMNENGRALIDMNQSTTNFPRIQANIHFVSHILQCVRYYLFRSHSVYNFPSRTFHARLSFSHAQSLS